MRSPVLGHARGLASLVQEQLNVLPQCPVLAQPNPGLGDIGVGLEGREVELVVTDLSPVLVMPEQLFRILLFLGEYVRLDSLQVCPSERSYEVRFDVGTGLGVVDRRRVGEDGDDVGTVVAIGIEHLVCSIRPGVLRILVADVFRADLPTGRPLAARGFGWFFVRSPCWRPR
ncbi:MAG: hypothetical protein M3381_11705 [Actinomycetota bacterium]|nr:hypothetical protein [Actinomycetota bacterium]